jgi:hypothetical protein
LKKINKQDEKQATFQTKASPSSNGMAYRKINEVAEKSPQQQLKVT